MQTLAEHPDENGYAVSENPDEFLYASVDGGNPRSRLDLIGGAYRVVNLQWTRNQTNLEPIISFFRENVGRNCEPFAIDLQASHGAYETYQAQVVPQSLKMTKRGLTRTLVAQLRIIPNFVESAEWPTDLDAGPAEPVPIIWMKFDESPLVESTGNGWVAISPPSDQPDVLAGTLRARPYGWEFYYMLQTNESDNLGLLLPTPAVTYEFFVSRAGDPTPADSSWQVGFFLYFSTVDFSYDMNIELSVGYVHNDVARPDPWIIFSMDGVPFLNISIPDTLLTLQSDRMTHVAFTIDDAGNVNVFCHGVLVGVYPLAIEYDEAETGLPFPDALYGNYFSLVQFFGDTTPAYLDELIVTAGVKYPAAFTPPLKPIPS